MDVIEILRKKRQQVTAYEIRMEGMRSEEHPRRYIAITLVHRITGHGVDRTAVEHAMALSSEKYCSVHHSLAKDIVFSQRAEVIEAA
mgnify:CR=1 FL=1